MPNPTCPSNCATALPAASFSSCAPEVNLAEISYIYLAKGIATAFTDWAAPTEWGTRVDNANTTGDDYIRKLTVIGDKPEPTTSEREISAGRKVNVLKTHVINFTIDETNDANHELLRSLECGGSYKIWYETKGGKIFGGNEGITASVFLNMVLNRGTDEIMAYNGRIEWKSKFTEEREVSPVVHS
jgi:hypothetical protein